MKGEKPYEVVVKVEGFPDWPVHVHAPREGLAKTRAMAHYPYRLTGELVTFEVTERVLGAAGWAAR